MTLIGRYQKRLSGPLLDRIDIHKEVCSVDDTACQLLGTATLALAGSARVRQMQLSARAYRRPANGSVSGWRPDTGIHTTRSKALI